MGPFELMDLIGIDVNLAVSESVYEQLGAERLEPRPMQRELVASNRLGRKSGSGFYTYQDGKHAQLDLAVPQPAQIDEFAVVVGFGPLAFELAEALQRCCARVQHIENDEMLVLLDPEATVVIDAGDGVNDRSEMLRALDRTLEPHVAILADAYVTDVCAAAGLARHPDRICGYGIVGLLADQRAVEIVDGERTSDDTLALAQELFEAAGTPVVLVEDRPGLYLGAHDRLDRQRGDDRGLGGGRLA